MWLICHDFTHTHVTAPQTQTHERERQAKTPQGARGTTCKNRNDFYSDTPQKQLRSSKKQQLGSPQAPCGSTLASIFPLEGGPSFLGSGSYGEAGHMTTCSSQRLTTTCSAHHLGSRGPGSTSPSRSAEPRPCPEARMLARLSRPRLRWSPCQERFHVRTRRLAS